MPTIIEELAMTLKLDPAGFEEGAQQTETAAGNLLQKILASLQQIEQKTAETAANTTRIQKTAADEAKDIADKEAKDKEDAANKGARAQEDAAKKAAKDQEDAAKRAAQSQKQAADTASEAYHKTANAIRRVGVELLAMLGIQMSVSAIERMFSGINKANTEAGYLARNIGMNIEQLTQWQNIASRVGGSSEGVAQAFAHVSQEQEKLKYLGTSEMVPAMRALFGVHAVGPDRKLLQGDALVEALREGAKRKGMSAADIEFATREAGIGGLAPLVQASDEDYNRAKNLRKDSGNFTTAADAEAAKRLTNDLDELYQRGMGVARMFWRELGPAITSIVERIDKWIERNRDWLNEKAIEWGRALANVITRLADDFDKFVNGPGAKEFAKTVGEVASSAKGAVDAVGGFGNAIKLLAEIWLGARIMGMLGLMARFPPQVWAITAALIAANLALREGEELIEKGEKLAFGDDRQNARKRLGQVQDEAAAGGVNPTREQMDWALYPSKHPGDMPPMQPPAEGQSWWRRTFLGATQAPAPPAETPPASTTTPAVATPATPATPTATPAAPMPAAPAAPAAGIAGAAPATTERAAPTQSADAAAAAIAGIAGARPAVTTPAASAPATPAAPATAPPEERAAPAQTAPAAAAAATGRAPAPPVAAAPAPAAPVAPATPPAPARRPWRLWGSPPAAAPAAPAAAAPAPTGLSSAAEAQLQAAKETMIAAKELENAATMLRGGQPGQAAGGTADAATSDASGGGRGADMSPAGIATAAGMPPAYAATLGAGSDGGGGGGGGAGGGEAGAGGGGGGGKASSGGGSGDSGPVRPGEALKGQGTLKANQAEAYNSARAEGLSDSSARALVANMSGEALGKPGDVHWDVSHTARGIVQWDPTRSEAIKKQFGKYPNEMSVADQTRAALWEIRNNPAYKATKDALQGEGSTTDKIKTLVTNYERPANAGAAINQRVGHLQGLPAQFAPPAPAAAPQTAAATPPPPQPSLPPRPSLVPSQAAHETLAGAAAPAPAANSNVPARDPWGNAAPAALGASATASGWQMSEENNNSVDRSQSNTTHIAALHVHSAANNAPGIATDIHREIRKFDYARQADTGLA